MTFKISKIKEAPVYDSLPVAKIVTYPLEERDYRPYAQTILCVSENALHLRMWAFELNPSPGSRLECVLYLFAGLPDTALSVVAAPEPVAGSDRVGCCLLKDGRDLPVSSGMALKLRELKIHPHNGEDLQGVYWGAAIDIPLNLLEEWGGKTLLNAGDRFPGNFYKICRDALNPHLGCFYKADFRGNPYLLPSMGEFEVVCY